jgi:TP901 family phage tail tape measure protein
MAAAGGIRAGRAFVEIFADDSALAQGLRRVEARLRGFGSLVGSIGASLAKAGVVAAVPFAASARAFEDFESAMARVKAITNASDADFARLGDEAKRLGRDTAFSATEAATAMGNFAQAGFSVDEIFKATAPTLDLAATAKIGVAEAADIATKVLRGMGLAVSDLGPVLDVMAKAATTSNTDIIMLGDAFKFVGPIAKTAGVSLEEITAAIQILSNAGIQGETAGTTLRGMILSLTSPSKEAAAALDQLGVRVKDRKGNFLSLAEILAQLQKGLKGLGTADVLEKLGTIFPARAAAGAAALVSQGSEVLGNKTAALLESTGTAARIARTQLDTLWGSVKVLTSSVQVLGVEVGAALAPTLRRWGDQITNLANALAIFAKENRGLIVTIGKAVVAVAGIGVAMVAAGAAARVLAAGLGVLRVASAALLSPLGLVAAGIAYLAYQAGAFDDLKKAAVDAFAGISDAIKGGDIRLAAKVLWLTLKVEWLKGTAALRDIAASVAADVTGGFGELSARIAGRMIDAVAAIKAAWAGLGGFFADLWAGIGAAFHAVVDPLEKAMNSFVGELAKHVLKLEALFTRRLIDPKLLADLQRIDKETADRNAAIDEAAAGRADAAKQRGLGVGDQALGIEVDRQAQRKALDDQRDVDAAARARAAREREARAADDLAGAQQELKAALDAAKAKARGAPGGGLVQSALGAIGGGAKDALKKAAAEGGEGLSPQGLDESLKEADRKTEARGTFSAAAISGLSVGETTADMLKDTVEVNKKQLKELEKIDKNTKEKPRFA